MNRLHHCILAALLLSALPLRAIVQTGNVRSITRHDQQSVAIEGCVVRVRGQHNAVQSRSTGEFSITLANLQNGQPYALSSVVKSGYEVAEQSLIGRQLPASTDVPLEILLVNREQLQREKEAIAERARQNVEIYYEARVAQLQADLAEKRLDSIGYARRMQDLEAKYERFEPLLQAMSDRYARTDISRLDSLSIRINEAIEHGNLDEAERLVHQKGDLDARLAEILDQDAVLQAAQQTLDEQQRQLNERQQQNDARRADLGDDYYRLYSICLSRFQNDSAAYYIRRRAALDTLNFDYQIQAGQFIKDIIADDALAMTYFRRAYRIAQEQYGEMTMQNATACHEIAATLKLQGDLEHALTQY
ncbi:MAG: hypothetical protein IJ680_04455, partial [Paludibacteraceae bacterium]|nr:hypothetical protein [Paludibacteraceae bacterium]